MDKNKLSDMEVSSVDLCKRGANQEAFIKLFKSAPDGKGGENQMNANKNLIDRIVKLLSGEEDPAGGEQTITKAVSTAQVRETTMALCKSLESIIADDSLSSVEKHDMMAESLQAFTVEATECMDAWASAIGKADEVEDPEDDDLDDDDLDDDEDPDDDDNNNEPGDEPESMKKGVFDMATINIEKMSAEDRATLEALEKKYAGTEAETQPEIHPDVQKAIDEVAELRKSLEIKDLANFAKKYEILGKKSDELAEKLYDLKKAGENHYNDYVALLDEQVQMQNSGIFKEIGSNRAGGTDLDGTVAELMKSEPTLTREQAICKAFEINPNLDPFTGKAK